MVTRDCVASHKPEIEALTPELNGRLYAHRNTASFGDTTLLVLQGTRSNAQWPDAAIPWHTVLTVAAMSPHDSSRATRS